MKKISNTILSLAVLLLATACSSTPQDENGSPKVYSSSTQREFEAIEKNDLNIAPTYRSSSKTPKSSNEAPPPKIPSPKIVPSQHLSAKNEERLQEINQQLAFFCMKHRKDPAFSNEEKCLQFTKKALEACEKKHQIINSVMLNCVKERLKKRR